MPVNNGATGILLIGGVHSGLAGVQRTEAGIIAAFVPNIGRVGKTHIGATAVLDGQSYRIAHVQPSPVTAGFVRVSLEKMAA